MWEKILDLLQAALTVHKELDRTRDEIKELRRDLLDLTLSVQQLSDKIDLNSQKQASDIENLTLRLQNYLLKYENERNDSSKSLPPKTVKKRKKPVKDK
jgi:hypothetical protein